MTRKAKRIRKPRRKHRIKLCAGEILENGEDVVPLDDLRQFVPDPPRRYATMWRWCAYGRKHPFTGEQVRLEAVYLTHVIASSKEAYDRFLRRINE